MSKIISLDIGKTWPLSKHGDIILNSMSKTREKQNSIVLNRVDFWMIWRCHGILCFHFYFLFRNNGKWEQFNENDLRHCYGIYLFIFESVILKFLDHRSRLGWKFFLNNYEASWQQHLKDALQLKILQTWINIGVEPALQSALHQDIWLIIECFSFFHTSLVFRFNLVMIELFFPQFIYLFANRYYVYLEVHPVPVSYFYKKQ